MIEKLGVLLALSAGITVGINNIFRKSASTLVNPLLGAAIISTVAAVIGWILVLGIYWDGKEKLMSDTKGIIFMVLSGVTVLLIDFLMIKAFSTKLPISIGSPLMTAGSISVAVLFGVMVLNESITWQKVLAVFFIIAAVILLNWHSGK